MEQVIIIVQVLVSVIMIALILVQHGKGADAGASFGAGASNTMFGSQGALPFLMKITVALAVVFFATNLGLSRLYYQSTKQPLQLQLTVPDSSVQVPASKSQTVPVKK